jgi:hypothetical protein
MNLHHTSKKGSRKPGSKNHRLPCLFHQYKGVSLGLVTVAAATIAATATTAATATVAATAATTTVAAATATEATATTAAAAATRTRGPFTGFVHRQWPAIDLMPIEGRDGSLKTLVGLHLHESKTTRPTGLAIRDHFRTANCTVRCKHRF